MEHEFPAPTFETEWEGATRRGAKGGRARNCEQPPSGERMGKVRDATCPGKRSGLALACGVYMCLGLLKSPANSTVCVPLSHVRRSATTAGGCKTAFGLRPKRKRTTWETTHLILPSPHRSAWMFRVADGKCMLARTSVSPNVHQ